MQRARRIIEKHCKSPLIDMHIWNSFREKGYYACSPNLYMDLFPYIDLLWIGEGWSYNTPKDYWLVSISGIPFGLPSQMLNHGGNKWRGMVFGMTNRAGWYGPTPKYIWRFWDEYKIKDMMMIGFWEENCPVKIDNEKIVATIYKGENRVIIAVANWTDKEQKGKLIIDWEKLGMTSSSFKMDIPFIEEYQNEMKLQVGDILRVEGRKGYLIVIDTI